MFFFALLCSFGIVLWEMFCREVPYDDASDLSFPYEMMSAILGGRRPLMPDSCPEDYSTLIVQCWQENADDRPLFSDIVLQLERMLETSSLPPAMP